MGRVENGDTYRIQRGDTLSRIADTTGVSVSDIMRLNPQIKDADRIFAGQSLIIRNSTRHYQVRPGDTLSGISQRYNTTVSALLRANPSIINSNRIYAGQAITIPSPSPTPAPRPSPAPTPAPRPTTPLPPVTPPSRPPTGSLNISPINLREFLSPELASDAPYSILVGVAEGNRTPNGGKLQGFYGHRDPGDGLWNIGSFSYSNARNSAQAASPEDADRFQLIELNRAVVPYETAMRAANLDPNNALAATVYLDMFNQSPRAAANMLKPENMAYLRENGMTVETMKEWRFRGFVNAATGERWVYPNGSVAGGNRQVGLAGIAHQNAQRRFGRWATEAEVQALIRRDQDRRVDAVMRPLTQMGLVRTGSSAPAVPTTPTPQPPTPPFVNGLPDTSGMTEARRFDFYAGYINENGDANARRDLADGQRVILGLRVETNTRQAAYDDRFVVLWRDANGTKHVTEVSGNTEPSSRYEDTPANRALGRAMGFDADGNGIWDLGRVSSGTREFGRAAHPLQSNFGRLQADGNNVLVPVENGPVQRDTNHDGFFRAATDENINGIDSDGRFGWGTMYFHRGGVDNPTGIDFTGSAGCQTMTQAEYNRFWRSLGTQQRFQYVLVTLD